MTAATIAATDARVLSITTVVADGFGDRESAGVVEVCDAYGRGGQFRVWTDGVRAGLYVCDPETDGEAPVLGRLGDMVREPMWAVDGDGELARLGEFVGVRDCVWVDERPYRLGYPSAAARALPRLYAIRADGTSDAPSRP